MTTFFDSTTGIRPTRRTTTARRRLGALILAIVALLFAFPFLAGCAPGLDAARDGVTGMR